jgi:hypothetical protein
MADKILRTYKYSGEVIGRLVELGTGNFRCIRFEPDLSEFQAIDLVSRMPPGLKIHMYRNAFIVYKLLEAYGIKSEYYISNEDILIHVADQGYHNLTELYHGCNRSWRLVKERGLEEELSRFWMERSLPPIISPKKVEIVNQLMLRYLKHFPREK